jgi:hypothetical protein
MTASCLRLSSTVPRSASSLLASTRACSRRTEAMLRGAGVELQRRSATCVQPPSFSLGSERSRRRYGRLERRYDLGSSPKISQVAPEKTAISWGFVNRWKRCLSCQFKLPAERDRLELKRFYHTLWPDGISGGSKTPDLIESVR